MTEAEIERIEQGIGQTLTDAVNAVAERQWAAQRDVEIQLSPLEKWLHREVLISAGEQRWKGSLVDFGGGWVEIAEGDLRLVIHTGAGITIGAIEAQTEEGEEREEGLRCEQPAVEEPSRDRAYRW